MRASQNWPSAAIIFVAAIATLLDCQAPKLAASGHIPPAQLATVRLLSQALTLAGAGLAVIRVLKGQGLALANLLATASALVAFSVCTLASSSSRQETQFLSAVAMRVQQQIGPNRLSQLFSTVEKDVQTGRRTGAPIKTADLPQDVRALFRHSVPQGNATFQGGELLSVQVRWGGPLFNWGLEVFGDVPTQYVQSGKDLTQYVSSNAVVFIGK